MGPDPPSAWGREALSVVAVAAFVAALFAVACRRPTVASGASAIPSRRRAIVGSGLALGPRDLGLIRFQCVADRRANVSLSGSSVSCLCRTVSGLSGAIGLVEVVLRIHGTEAYPPRRSDRPRVPLSVRPAGWFAARCTGQT